MGSIQLNEAPAPTVPPSLGRWGLRLGVYPLFFASGAAGLIYEVVWTRTLLAVFGAGLYAVCAVLAAFMAGLALGSWALGLASDRLRRPLLVYALLEAAIGVSGALMLPLLRHAGVLDIWAAQHTGPNSPLLTGFRFALAFGLMLAPTTLMGATLPMLSRFLVRDASHLGMHVGSLYSINTFGAVCGAFAAGFVLIARLGLQATEWLAAGMNLAVAAGALAIALAVEGRRAAVPPPPKAAPAGPLPATPGEVQWVLFTAFATGLVSLAAQVLWSRALVFDFEYLKNTTYTFSAMLTVFLAGLAIGSALIGLIVDEQREPLRLYGILLTLLGMSILFSIVMLYYGAHLLQIADEYDADRNYLNWGLAVGNVILKTIGVLGAPTLLMGMAFPVAARVVVRVGRVGRDVGRLYALNTIGAIAGSLLAGFVIVPALGLTGGLIALGIVDLALGLATFWRGPGATFQRLAFTVVALGMVGAIFITMREKEGRTLQLVTANERQVFYQEGPLATVAVVENELLDRMIYVDGVGVAGTDPVMQTDQKSLAHVPMCLLGHPKSALTVGFGSGGCSYSLLLHDRLEKVHCVEICPTVLNAASTLSPANHLFFGAKSHPLTFAATDPRYEIILDDARAYLRYTAEKYDFIATDCTDLRYKSNANLYDLEYFQACRQRLTKDGIVVVWMPLAGLHRDIFRTALRTFHKVFPAMGVFFMDNEPTHYILLIGWQDKVKLDYSLFARTLKEPDVRNDLGELYLDDPVKLLSCFITGGEALDKFLAGTELNTENNPVIEFESPRYGYIDQPVLDNLNDLLAIHVSPTRFMAAGTLPPAEAARLAQYEKALPLVIRGLGQVRRMELEKAARSWIEAAKLTPRDWSLTRNLMTFPILQQRIQAMPGSWFDLKMLGRLNMIEEHWAEANQLLTQAETVLNVRVAQPDATPEVSEALNETHQWLLEIRQKLPSPGDARP